MKWPSWSKRNPKKKEVMTPNTWLDDSTALSHLCNDDDDMFEWRHINSPVKIGVAFWVGA
jgi:hypothetical protein